MIEEDTGRLSVVETMAGSKVQTHFVIVPGDSLVVSNNPDGTINPKFPAELQPRNRTKLYSRLQVSRIAQSISPANLGDSESANAGSPIIGPDYVVESGNGRVMGLLRAYASNRANHYQRYLSDHAGVFGLTRSDVLGMDKPILVRLRTSNVNRAQFARDANFTPGQLITESLARQIEDAILLVERNPTDAQKEIGNYTKGHVSFQGLPLTFENPKGSVRRGVDGSGRAWESPIMNHYGYIKRTEGADGDHVDFFLGHDLNSEHVFIINQRDTDSGAFDEHKVMLGFGDEATAHSAYLANYETGWDGLDSIHQLHIDDFKSWLSTGDTTTPYRPEAMLEAVGPSKKRLNQAMSVLEGVSSLVELIERVQTIGFDMTDPENKFDNMTKVQAGIKSAIQRLTQTTPDNPTALKGYRAYMKSLLGGASFSDLNSSRYDGRLQTITDGVYSAGIYINKMDAATFKRYLTDGSCLQIVLLIDQFQTTRDRPTGRKLARAIIKVAYDAMLKKAGKGNLRVQNDFVATMKHFCKEPVTAQTVINIFKTSQQMDESALAPEQAAKMLDDHQSAGAVFLESANLGAAKQEAVQRLSEFNDRLKSALNGRVKEGDGFALDTSIAYLAKNYSYHEKLDALSSCIDANQFGSGWKARRGGFGHIEALESIMRLANAKSWMLSSEDRKAFDEDSYHISVVKAEYLKAVSPLSKQIGGLKDKLTTISPMSKDAALSLRGEISIDPKVITKCRQKCRGDVDLESLVTKFIQMVGHRPDSIKKFVFSGERAHASLSQQLVQMGSHSDASAVWHEMGHHVEFMNPDLLAIVKQYLLRKNGGENNNVLSLKDQIGGNYDSKELAINDHLSHPYIGKVYDDDGSISSMEVSEVISSGFELLMNPEKAAESHLNGDGLLELITSVILELQKNA